MKTEIDKIITQIEKEYNKLNMNENNFFETYHDIMLTQRDCAYEESEEYDYYITHSETFKANGKVKTNIDCAKECIITLNNILKYMKAIIQLQELTRKLPEPIFG